MNILYWKILVMEGTNLFDIKPYNLNNVTMSLIFAFFNGSHCIIEEKCKFFVWTFVIEKVLKSVLPSYLSREFLAQYICMISAKANSTTSHWFCLFVIPALSKESSVIMLLPLSDRPSEEFKFLVTWILLHLKL